MSKQFWAFVVVIVLIFVGIFVFTGKKSPSTSNSSSPSNLSQHIEGQGKSGVKLIEYGDYQCPYCGQAYPVIKQVVADLNSQITFQFRNFPLTSLHPNAFAGARAAEAASLQGKFWQMHDLMFAHQQELSDAKYAEWATQIGLDLARWQKDKESPEIAAQIQKDNSYGQSVGADGTPSFFVNGRFSHAANKGALLAVGRPSTPEKLFATERISSGPHHRGT